MGGVVSLANDMTALMSTWGQTLTVVRKSVSYGTSGSDTYTWTQKDQQTGMIQPYTRRADTLRVPEGVDVHAEFEVYLPVATVIQEDDRIRPSGWAAGQDEYHVLHVLSYSSSHIEAFCELVKGHAS